MADLQPNGDPEVEAFIRHHVEVLNKANATAIAADFTADCVLVDAFPPFVWSGPSAATRWWSDLKEIIKPVGLEKVAFKLGDWQRVYVSGESAYAVAHASAIISGPAFAVEAKGTWTFVLKRSGAAWKIASWNWGGPPANPVAL